MLITEALSLVLQMLRYTTVVSKSWVNVTDKSKTLMPMEKMDVLLMVGCEKQPFYCGNTLVFIHNITEYMPQN